MKHLFFVAILLFNTLAFSAPLTVGVLKFAPPFSAQSGVGNHFFGFTVDLMDALCQRLNQQCIYVGVELDEQLQALDDGSIDLVVAPNPIQPSMGNYRFSLPYLASNGQFIALNGSGINSIAELKNKQIGVLRYSLFQSLVQSRFADAAHIQEYQTFSDLLSALLTHQVAAIMFNDSVANYVVNNNMNDLKLVGQKIPMGNGYGILALKKNSTLLAQINKALLEIEADGTYISIYNRYFE